MKKNISFVVRDRYNKVLGVIDSGRLGVEAGTRDFISRLDKLLSDEYGAEKGYDIEWIDDIHKTDYGEECRIEFSYYDDDENLTTEYDITLLKTVRY